MLMSADRWSKAVLSSGSLVAGVADIVSGTIANQKNYEFCICEISSEATDIK